MTNEVRSAGGCAPTGAGCAAVRKLGAQEGAVGASGTLCLQTDHRPTGTCCCHDPAQVKNGFRRAMGNLCPPDNKRTPWLLFAALTATCSSTPLHSTPQWTTTTVGASSILRPADLSRVQLRPRIARAGSRCVPHTCLPRPRSAESSSRTHNGRPLFPVH